MHAYIKLYKLSLAHPVKRDFYSRLVKKDGSFPGDTFDAEASFPWLEISCSKDNLVRPSASLSTAVYYRF